MEIRSQSHPQETSITRLMLVLRQAISSFPFNSEQQNYFSLRWWGVTHDTTTADMSITQVSRQIKSL